MTTDPAQVPINPFQPPSDESSALQPLGPQPFDEDAARQGTPWEQGTGPWLQRFLETAWGVYRSPGKFFDRVKLNGSVLSPLLFNVAGIAFAVLLLLGYTALALAAQLDFEQFAFVLSVAVFGNITFNLLFAVALHLPLWALWGLPRRLTTTLRTVLYAGGAASLLFVVPVAGGSLCGLVLLWFTWIGMARTQNVRWWQMALVLIAWALMLLLAILALGAIMFFFAWSETVNDVEIYFDSAPE